MFLYWKKDHFAYYLVGKVDLQSIFTSEMSKKSIFKLYKVFFSHKCKGKAEICSCFYTSCRKIFATS